MRAVTKEKSLCFINVDGFSCAVLVPWSAAELIGRVGNRLACSSYLMDAVNPALRSFALALSISPTKIAASALHPLRRGRFAETYVLAAGRAPQLRQCLSAGVNQLLRFGRLDVVMRGAVRPGHEKLVGVF